jgi:hypothetical protein
VQIGGVRSPDMYICIQLYTGTSSRRPKTEEVRMARARARRGAAAIAARRGHPNVIHGSAPAHATLAQPAAGADALKDLRAQRAQPPAENPKRFPEDLVLNFRA